MLFFQFLPIPLAIYQVQEVRELKNSKGHDSMKKTDSMEKKAFSQLKNDKFLKVLNGQSVDSAPVWLMRQAGRYLPEYREIRSNFSDFMALCRSSEATTELALQPIRRFNLDAAIVFSDILTITDSLDLGLSFQQGQGPVISRPIKSPSDVSALPFDECLHKLGYVYDAVRSLREALGNRLPIIGFTGSPWTQACYMIEGQSQAHFHAAKMFAYAHPVTMRELIDELAQVSAKYLYGQYMAGADVLFVIDTWGCLLPDDLFEVYSAKALKEICHYLEKMNVSAPVLFYSKSLTQNRVNFLYDCPLLKAVAVDWTQDIAKLQLDNPCFTFQGNLDPVILKAGPMATQQHAFNLLNKVNVNSRYIASFGHGILPETPLESVHSFIDTVRNYSKLVD